MACHSIWTDSNQLKGSIPSELGEVTSLTYLGLRTCIGLSCWHEINAYSHFLAILFEQMKINSRVQFLANSEHWRCWLLWGSVRALVSLVLFAWTWRLLTFPCHSVWSEYNQLTGSIPTELGALTSLTALYLSTCIGFSCFVRMNLTPTHISLPFCLISVQSTHGFNSNWTRSTDVVD